MNDNSMAMPVKYQLIKMLARLNDDDYQKVNKRSCENLAGWRKNITFAVAKQYKTQLLIIKINF